MNFDELSQYEIDGELQFIEIEHGFVYAEINNARAHATVSTYSGQLLSYRPKTSRRICCLSATRHITSKARLSRAASRFAGHGLARTLKTGEDRHTALSATANGR